MVDQAVIRMDPGKAAKCRRSLIRSFYRRTLPTWHVSCQMANRQATRPMHYGPARAKDDANVGSEYPPFAEATLKLPGGSKAAKKMVRGERPRTCLRIASCFRLWLLHDGSPSRRPRGTTQAVRAERRMGARIRNGVRVHALADHKDWRMQDGFGWYALPSGNQARHRADP